MAKNTKKPSLKQQVATKVVSLKRRLQTYKSKRPHRSFKRTKRPKNFLGGKKLGPITPLLTDTATLIWSHKRVFLGMTVIYAVLTYFIVGGASQVDFIALREATLDVLGGELSSFGTTFGLFSDAITGTVTQPPTALQQFIGSVFAFLFWLAVVWAARMILAKQKITMRDALYNSGAPMIPSFLVLLAVAAQMLPAIIGLFALAVVQEAGWITGGVELMTMTFATILLCLMSVYWLAGSFLAMVIITLPQMYPWKALSAASELVIGQRWQLATRLVALTLSVVLVWAVVVLAAVFFDKWLHVDWLPIVPVILQALSALTLLYSSVYIYKLYRSML